MTAKKTETADPGVAVVFARPWTVDGKSYQPDEAAVIPTAAADDILRLGYARPDVKGSN